MKSHSWLLLLCPLGLLFSCGNPKKLAYLQGPMDPANYSKINYKEPTIKEGDILGITVYSDNPTASALYNQASQPAQSSNATSNATNIGGYLVDQNGDIVFHSLGNIHVKGLSRGEVGSILSEKLKEVLKNPYCQVRFNNFKITVIGEVNNPSVFSIPSERISLLEVLGLAGDLTSYGRRDSVLVIRETDTTRTFGWLDLRKTDIFNSEYFYLQQNDVVMVRPNKRKSTADDQVTTRNIGILATLVSTTAIIITLFR